MLCALRSLWNGDHPLGKWRCVTVTGVQSGSPYQVVTADVSGLPGGATFSVTFESSSPPAAGTPYDTGTSGSTPPVLELNGAAESRGFTVGPLWAQDALVRSGPA